MSTSDDFFKTYERLFGTKPPRRFRAAYGVLAEAIYWGIARQDKDERPPGKRQKRSDGGWPIHEWQLLPAKAEVDTALAQIARALQRWERRRGEAQSRPSSERDR